MESSSRLSSEPLARVAFGVTSVLVTYGLLLQFVLAVRNDEGLFLTGPGRFVNTLSYFTIESNILVAVTTGLLALRLDRPSTAFRVLRLSGLVGIAITGVVFHIALADLQELSGKEAAADWVLHTASPLLCVAGWLFFGPRRQISRQLVGLSVLFPVVWLTYTLIRGALVQDRFGRDYYPYPFLDVATEGYAKVAVNLVLVAVLFAALAGGALILDRRLPGIPGSAPEETGTGDDRAWRLDSKAAPRPQPGSSRTSWPCSNRRATAVSVRPGDRSGSPNAKGVASSPGPRRPS